MMLLKKDKSCLLLDTFISFYENALRLMTLDLIDVKSTLVQVMA